MGYYSNAGQNLATQEQIGVAKIVGAAVGIKHILGAKESNPSNVALSKEVGALGEEETRIAENTQKLEQDQKDFAKLNETMTKTENELVSQQERYKKLQEETGMNNPAFEEHWNAAKSSSDKARDMYNRSMDEMRKRAVLLDIQRKSFETRKGLIMRAIEGSGK